MVESIVVLHVDDDTDFARRAADALEHADDRIDVRTATGVGDARDHLASDDVDCVVAEVALPDGDGIELFERVREDDPDLPFVVLTGEDAEAAADRALSAGVTDYLYKDGSDRQFALLARRLGNYVSAADHRAWRRRHREAVETTGEGIAIMDETGEFVYVNDACCTLYGYDREELLGATWELVHPESSREFIEETVIPTIFEEGRWDGVTTGVRADGSTFVEDHTLRRTDDGEFVCTVRDITESRERERELERYETIVEAMGDGVYVLDADGCVVEVNETVVEMVGEDYDDIVGSSARQYYGGSNLERIERAFSHLLSDDEQSVVTVGVPLERADGTVIPVEINLTLLPCEDGEFQGTVGVVRDVSERRERERELERYETLIELMPDTVVVTDMAGTITEIHGFEGWSGYEYDELVGEHMSKTMPEADVARAKNIVSELVRSDERSKATYEHYTVTKDGDHIFYENHLTLLPPDEDGQIPGTMSVLRDISERKARERELQRQNERLEEFAGIVSHDLRNPLTVASARLELARSDCDSEHLAAVERSHDRMERLIEDLLALARDTESVEDETAVDVATLAEAAWQYVDASGATLHVETDVTAVARESRLRQLLENLLGNAVEHGGDDVTVRIGALGDDGFYVADDGPGIPADERDRIFESGYTTAEEGTGFGLAIVEDVATAHGWSVAVSESESGGARFEIRWDGE